MASASRRLGNRSWPWAATREDRREPRPQAGTGCNGGRGTMIGMAANVVVALVALLHAWFLVLEMFLWDRPIGMRTFRLTPERARDTKALAANQGLYNGFLVAGLLW